MTEAQWETIHSRSSYAPNGVVTLHDIEPGYEYRATVHLMPGYSVIHTQRRKLAALAAHEQGSGKEA